VHLAYEVALRAVDICMCNNWTQTPVLAKLPRTFWNLHTCAGPLTDILGSSLKTYNSRISALWNARLPWDVRVFAYFMLV
jgi:hypothetical protein